MKSATDLVARLGGHMRESMGTVQAPALHGGTPAPAGPALHGGAQKYQGAARIKDALSIEIGRIIPDPNQPRKEFDQDALANLAASLKAKGQLQPVLVRWDEPSGRWAIIAGERRYRAAQLAGLAALTCVEFKGDPTADDLMELQLVENALREDLKPIEQASAFKALIDRRGWSHRQLAENLSIAASSVARALALLELPADVQEQVAAGTLAPSVAYEVSRIEDPETIRAVAAEVVASGLNRSEAVERVRQATRKPGKGAKGRGPRSIKTRVVRTPSGKVTVDLRKAGDAGAILATLEEAVAVLRAEQGGEAEAA